MRFTVDTSEQKSAEWFKARSGRLTSSEADVIYMEGRKKGSESTTKRDLRIRLALERISGRSLDGEGYESAAMKYGTEREADARLAYEAHTGVLLEQVGFLAHTELLIGCSPDGVLPDFSGGAELKCPKTATHLEYLRTPGVPDDYVAQLRHQLLVTGAEYWDFVSFDDRGLPESLQLCVRRLWAKDAELPAHELAVRNFMHEVERQQAEIEALAESLRTVAA
jgi:predicted phage-related endonuclease